MNKRSLRIMKWVWAVAVFLAAGLYAFRNWQTLGDQMAGLAVWRLVISFGLVITGKLVLAELARWSLLAERRRYSHRQMLYLCSLSQLGKYLPGGVWHLVGRGAFYQSHGVAMSLIGRSLILENLWLLLSAIGFGASLTWAALADRWLAGGPVGAVGMRLIGALLLLLVWAVTLTLVTRLACAKLDRYRPNALAVFFGQCVVWTSLGLSLAVLTPGVFTDIRLLLLAPGSLALGWAAGYVTPFAPAGLGVREAGAVALMTQVLPLPQATFLVATTRLVWTGAELLLGAVSYVLYKGATPTTHSNVSPEMASSSDP